METLSDRIRKIADMVDSDMIDIRIGNDYMALADVLNGFADEIDSDYVYSRREGKRIKLVDEGDKTKPVDHFGNEIHPGDRVNTIFTNTVGTSLAFLNLSEV